MGDFNVRKFEGDIDKVEYNNQILADIEALDRMIKEDKFEKSPIHIGAEQEFCLVDENWNPSQKGWEILADIDDPHFTSELMLYSLELNLEPFPLTGESFSEMHTKLDTLLEKAERICEKHGVKMILTGILPTIQTDHLDQSYMTPQNRYKVLNEALLEIRQDEIELHIKGVDEVNLHHETILYEGCNTSFQAHLQIDPAEFSTMYNWAQAIAGPILSVCTNSPLLLGKELWEETRIALFTQSVDTRASTHILNEKESRVGFGNEWVTGNVTDFYKDTVIGFRGLLTTDFESNSLDELDQGIAPKLKSLNLHNGTIYKWNRVCYGVNENKPHIRIENRYMPSGPTTTDEIANMMLWVGVMMGRPKEFDDIHATMDFKDAKSNFFNAARYGMGAQFHWDGELISSHDLLLDHFLPMAYRGLYKMGVAPKDAERYLPIIKNRIRSRNGSRWIVESLRKLQKGHKTPEALRILLATMYERNARRYTIDAWLLPRGNEYMSDEKTLKVQDIMTTKTLTAQENDSVELVMRMMQWKDIHHTPILNKDSNLCGILSWTDIEPYSSDPDKLKVNISDMMQKDLITVAPSTLKSEAAALMKKHDIHCLPVVHGKRLIGIVTSNDL